MFPHQLPRPDESKNGFALIVTLTLMILLSILAVGLLGLSSVALRTSSQGDSQAEARANARMALMMAIAELQKELGPDSRISAPQDANPTPPAGGQPRWTAVYDAWKWNADAATPETPQSRNPTFRRWLVSGANAANGGPAGTGEILLVGSNSLSASSQLLDQIKVPMLPVSRGNRKGMIAWWTSDESMKAKINAGGEAPLASNPLSDSQSPRYIGHKAIDVLKNFDWKPGQRSISVSTAGVNLAANLGSSGLRGFSHDATVYSNGVITDVRGGHLKRDLSNLLSRPIAELEHKPLFLPDGRINRFQIASDGSLTNNSWVPVFDVTKPNPRWGINLEELHLFHELHREVDWSTGKPQLVNKSSRSGMLNDRFFIYRQPTLEAVCLIMYLTASAEPRAPTAPPTATTTYRLDMSLDTIVSLSNPNDIPTAWPASVNLRVVSEGFPYRPKWNIPTPGRTPSIINHTVQAMNSGFFVAMLRNGFTLQPGEAAVFGASVTDTQANQVNLTRGFQQRGGVRIRDEAWDTDNKNDENGDGIIDADVGLRATGLRLTDKVGYSMLAGGGGNTPSGWLFNYAQISDASGLNGMSSHKFGGGNNSAMQDATYMPLEVKPEATSTPTVSSILSKPIPILMVTTMSNVERSRTTMPPNALPSRPYLLHEPATAHMTSLTTVPSTGGTNLLTTMQNSQLLTIAEPFSNTRIPTDSKGNNLYQGGAREVGFGGSINVIKRRIPMSVPLSLGAFENAIACGFTSPNRTRNAKTLAYTVVSPILSAAPEVLPTLPVQRMWGTGLEPEATKVTLAKSIGNSWTNPFLKSDIVQDGTYHDQSWMANTALWDTWFLCGIVSPGPSAAWNSDSRTQKQQFLDLAERTKTLRNARLTYHPHKSTTDALDELFSGDNLKPAAIDKLTKYLLVDGAFNVNSTSATAWKAFLTSVREQELLDANGAASKKTHPFGTLGHAVNSATTGTEGDWAGFRDLPDSDIDRLAKAIVTEVKARGPFLNMADFVNRRPNSSDPTQRALGALQAAIDKSGINNRFTTAGRSLVAADVAMLAGNDTLVSEPAPARAVGAAGFLSQGALLTAFGSQVTVRGDTFVIRTYGDSRDSKDNIQAKAWCEAVVQRTPEYVDPANPPEASANLSAANTTFGRKFNIVSFRWLSQNEI